MPVASKVLMGLQILQILVQSSFSGMYWASQIHRGLTWQLTGSVANILISHYTFSGVHALKGRGCFGSKRGTYTLLGN